MKSGRNDRWFSIGGQPHNWVPPVWKPSPEVEHCVKCHGPDSATQKARKWNQQGHMECLMCHTDHMA